jgi:hypothetical protein
MYSTMHKLKRFLLVFVLIWARSHGVRLHKKGGPRVCWWASRGLGVGGDKGAGDERGRLVRGEGGGTVVLVVFRGARAPPSPPLPPLPPRARACLPCLHVRSLADRRAGTGRGEVI